MTKEDSLFSLRERIDEMDQSLLALLNQRAQLSLDVALLKEQEGLPRKDEAREEQLIEGLVVTNPGPLADQDVRLIFQFLLERFRSLPLPGANQEVD